MEEIREIIFEAREELKRLEHIIYVSLKYTRTIDVIVNALARLVSIYDKIIEAFLEFKKKEDESIYIAKNPALRAKTLKELYVDDEEMQKHLIFYYFLKTILNLPHSKREEFRRHVTLVVSLDNNSTAEIDIDNLSNCEKTAHKFFMYAKVKILDYDDEEDKY